MASIRRYQTDPASAEEVMRQVNEGFIPIVKDAYGFLAYYALNAGALSTELPRGHLLGISYLRPYVE